MLSLWRHVRSTSPPSEQLGHGGRRAVRAWPVKVPQDLLNLSKLDSYWDPEQFSWNWTSLGFLLGFPHPPWENEGGEEGMFWDRGLCLDEGRLPSAGILDVCHCEIIKKVTTRLFFLSSIYLIVIRHWYICSSKVLNTIVYSCWYTFSFPVSVSLFLSFISSLSPSY